MTKKESKLVRKYAKAMHIDPKINMRLYEHGDKTQREIDYIAMRVTLLLRQARHEGKLKADDKGELTKESKKEAENIIQGYLKSRSSLPSFFKKPLPIKMVESEVENKTAEETV